MQKTVKICLILNKRLIVLEVYAMIFKIILLFVITSIFSLLILKENNHFNR